jgi:hypothetical protein
MTILQALTIVSAVGLIAVTCKLLVLAQDHVPGVNEVRKRR